MTNDDARDIIRCLIDGIDPRTGEMLPDDHLCNEPGIIRALHTAELALPDEASDDNGWVNQNGRLNAGRPWTDDDIVQLRALYQKGESITVICNILQRRKRGVERQLQALGISSPSNVAPGRERAGMPWNEEDTSQLRRMFEQRLEIANIARELHRSRYSIFCRMVKLNLYGDVDGYPNREDSLNGSIHESTGD